jgi:hypothetical protein
MKTVNGQLLQPLNGAPVAGAVAQYKHYKNRTMIYNTTGEVIGAAIRNRHNEVMLVSAHVFNGVTRYMYGCTDQLIKLLNVNGYINQHDTAIELLNRA